MKTLMCLLTVSIIASGCCRSLAVNESPVTGLRIEPKFEQKLISLTRSISGLSTDAPTTVSSCPRNEIDSPFLKTHGPFWRVTLDYPLNLGLDPQVHGLALIFDSEGDLVSFHTQPIVQAPYPLKLFDCIKNSGGVEGKVDFAATFTGKPSVKIATILGYREHYHFEDQDRGKQMIQGYPVVLSPSGSSAWLVIFRGYSITIYPPGNDASFTYESDWAALFDGNTGFLYTTQSFPSAKKFKQSQTAQEVQPTK